MALWMPREPILARPITGPVPVNMAVEPKWDGFRALVARRADGAVVLRSRRGTDLTRAFPDITTAALRLPPVLLDGEVVIWDGTRLAFGQLGRRLSSSPAGALRLAAELPAHMVLFDILDEEAGVHWAARPYIERRAALENLFAREALGPPWTLCPATTADDLDTISTWMSWSVAGIEGLLVKPPFERYRPGRSSRGGWGKLRIRNTTEAIVGGVTGSPTRPSALVLGRLDEHGRLRYAGRTSRIRTPEAQDVAALLTPARPEHPWQGMTIAAAWGSRDRIEVAPVDPQLVAEISADTNVDAGRWRNPVRFLRLRADLQPTDTPVYGAGNEPATG